MSESEWREGRIALQALIVAARSRPEHDSNTCCDDVSAASKGPCICGSSILECVLGTTTSSDRTMGTDTPKDTSTTSILNISDQLRSPAFLFNSRSRVYHIVPCQAESLRFVQLHQIR